MGAHSAMLRPTELRRPVSGRFIEQGHYALVAGYNRRLGAVSIPSQSFIDCSSLAVCATETLFGFVLRLPPHARLIFLTLSLFHEEKGGLVEKQLTKQPTHAVVG